MDPKGSVSRNAELWRTRLAGLLTLLLPLVFGLLLTLGDFGLVTQVRHLLFDEYQRLDPRVWRDDLPVRIIDIDEASLARYGQWPWPRDLLAKLTRQLAQAHPAAVAFDILFAEEDRLSPQRLIAQLPASPERDALSRVLERDTVDPFTQALGEVPSVLALALTSQPSPDQLFTSKASFAELGQHVASVVPTFAHAVLPLPAFRAAATGLGAINYLPDRDSIVRQVPTVFALMHEGETTLVPSLDAEALRVAQTAGTIILKSTQRPPAAMLEAKIGDITLVTERDGAVRIRFAGHQAGRFIPAWRVIEGEVAPSELTGRILLVGTSAAALSDTRSTPLDAAVPGVEIHAELLEHALTGARLNRLDYAPGIEAFVLVLASLFAGTTAMRLRPLTATLATAAIIALIGASSWLAFQHGDLLFDPILPGATTLATFGAVTLRLYRRSDRDKRRVRAAFSRYLAPAVVERLAADPTRLRLGGEARELTILFCDAREFTARAEKLDAQSVVAFLNALHTPLTDAVLTHAGTIDKFIGDGLMAFWNAPHDVADHATKACAAALAMLECVPGIEEKLAAATEDQEPPRVSIGIGINTGDAFVGNMGSEQRFDYSAVGDNVNIAARLEAATKDLHVPILVSEATARAATGFHFVDLGSLSLRGKKDALRVYALHGRDSGDESFAAFLSLHARALGGDAGAREAARLHPDGARYAAFYAASA
ncbi:MAG: adenylate/guanylate cyclase protein [Hyphomicrobiales bacterium]|nr:adenylate/guanylate cyclase protein [Hyphomicrobiales bacterium]